MTLSRSRTESPSLKLFTAVLPSLVALALVVPVTASAATLSVNKRCYGPGEEIAFSGGGYTPNSPVAISVGGQQLGVTTANSVGEIAVSDGAPVIRGKRRTDTYTATDQANLSLTASAAVTLTSLGVKVTPKNGNPAKAKRVVARGFTTGKTLWAHVRLGNAKRNVKVGKLTSFPQAVKLKPDEVVVFSYIVYKNRAARDKINKKIMEDPRLKDMMAGKEMPFDGKRMIYGGFETLVELGA